MGTKNRTPLLLYALSRAEQLLLWSFYKQKPSVSSCSAYRSFVVYALEDQQSLLCGLVVALESDEKEAKRAEGAFILSHIRRFDPLKTKVICMDDVQLTDDSVLQLPLPERQIPQLINALKSYAPGLDVPCFNTVMHIVEDMVKRGWLKRNASFGKARVVYQLDDGIRNEIRVFIRKKDRIIRSLQELELK